MREAFIAQASTLGAQTFRAALAFDARVDVFLHSFYGGSI